MKKLDKILYTAKVHTTGGREGGVSRTDDGRLQVSLSQPGTSGTGTNPEQLLAAGWLACFLSAVKLIAGKKKIALPAEVAVDADVYLGLTQGAYGLGAGLNVSLPGMDQAVAQSLVDEASHICPYSVAMSGSIEVKYNVTTSEPVALHA